MNTLPHFQSNLGCLPTEVVERIFCSLPLFNNGVAAETILASIDSNDPVQARRLTQWLIDAPQT